MKYHKALGLLLVSTQALLINAEKVTFKVLAVNGQPTLNINGQKIQMESPYYPLFEAEADVSQFPVQYNYSIDYGNGETKDEAFTRKREQNEDALNEFFDRQITILNHPRLPRAYEELDTLELSKLYDDNYVATIIVKCDENQLNDLYQNTSNTAVKAQVIYASPYAVKTFNDAQILISGQSTRQVPKLSYKIKNLKNDKGKELYNRSTIKLRAEHMDPSLIRDKLYGDILNSIGLPAAQNRFARLFINGESIGLFNLTDDITSKSYLEATFNKGKQFSDEDYSLFKGDFCPSCESPGFGDLGYYGEDPTNGMYAIYSYKGSDKKANAEEHFIKEFLPLLKGIQDYDTSGDASKMPFDIDTFLKYMAMEFIAGGVDNYWNKPGNFYVFKDLKKNQWYFHDSDFHFTFGCGGSVTAMKTTPLAEYPPLLEENVGKERPPLDAIRKSPENEEKFKGIFQRLLNTAFHPKAIYPRIDSLANLIREDVEWDIPLPKVNPNPTLDTDLKFTMEDFNSHVTEEIDVENDDRMPIKSFLSTRINNLVQELGIQVPTEFENNLGLVDFSSIEGEDTSNAISRIMISITSWKLFIIPTFLTILYVKLFY
ncbi:hypothetical protein BCR32DRAFT_264125 [Anaeromyces robustus]|uniref:Coth-domain-containing protein n=1 Tax=Anaeromyces robustus TaxID=1754192 RepID=A0A1Y1XPN4_9FUNG|nr:hypothetical protein BCR32DRAFT_264125 [Anaeromyces robustus]|eukprot:ORX87707.1 hypothetical protein BCR32DRAFT_264125 [Anaeromyces robustus]